MSAVAAGAAPAPVQVGWVQRADALALSVGSRITISTLMMACVLVIAVGAASLLDTLRKMDADLKVMVTELGIANEGTDRLNVQMNSLPNTRKNIATVVESVEATSAGVVTSKAALAQLNTSVTKMNGSLVNIAKSTGAMRSSLEGTSAGTETLATTIDGLNGKITPLVATQHEMLGETGRMQDGLCAMNGSLAYTIRTLNYLTAPPTGGGFTVRVEMDKSALPPVPGVVAKADPVTVFQRGSWPVYNEKGPAYAC